METVSLVERTSTLILSSNVCIARVLVHFNNVSGLMIPSPAFFVTVQSALPQVFPLFSLLQLTGCIAALWKAAMWSQGRSASH